MGGERGEQESEGEEEKFHELSAREKGIKRSEDEQEIHCCCRKQKKVFSKRIHEWLLDGTQDPELS